MYLIQDLTIASRAMFEICLVCQINFLDWQCRHTVALSQWILVFPVGVPPNHWFHAAFGYDLEPLISTVGNPHMTSDQSDSTRQRAAPSHKALCFLSVIFLKLQARIWESLRRDITWQKEEIPFVCGYLVMLGFAGEAERVEELKVRAPASVKDTERNPTSKFCTCPCQGQTWVNYISGWWFGTWILWLSIQLGMSSSQLTNSYFSEG